MTSPLTLAVQRLLDRPGIVQLSNDTADALIAEGDSVLFFTGNAVRYPEIDDVAVILPELLAAFGNRFKVGVINPDTDRAAAKRFKVDIRPSLVFFREGKQLGILARVRDWAIYLDEISALYAAPQTMMETI
ncbi:MAG: hydrogenase [Acidocella sp.]|nr:hydrogenase [Acidocella sp.]MDE8349540.1 hydrogenase [Acidocella sp.]